MSEPAYCWEPQDGPQGKAIAAASWCEELFFGGAVFGGKTAFLLGDFAMDIDQGSIWKGALFRQTVPEFEDLIERSKEIYPHLGGRWFEGRKTWRFPTEDRGEAILRMRHLEDENDFQKYMGWSLSWIGFDELPNWASMTAYHMLKSRLRGPAQRKRMRSTGNPGGLSHLEIKEYFRINKHKGGYRPYLDPVSKMHRMFIPSRVLDNKIGMASDPGYIDRLRGMGDPELVKMWEEGDWDSIKGAYFSMFQAKDCEVEPFEIPEGWSIFTGGDYGEENPCWWGVVAVDFDDTVWVVDEYFRAGAGGRDHARGVRALVDHCPFIKRHRPRLHLAPHDMWTKRRPGEASQALAPADSFQAEGIHLTRANMERVNGWRNIKDLMYSRQRISGLLSGPRIRFFRGRTDNVVSSLTTAQRDSHNVEDVMKAGNDHPADGLRYIVNHVYKPRQAPKELTPVGSGAHVLKMLEGMRQPVGVGRYG